MKINLIKVSLCIACAPLFFVSPAVGATIVWDVAPTTVNLGDETQVSTDGTLLTAINFFAPNTDYAPNDSGSATATVVVNGVTFVNINAPGGVAHVSTVPSGGNVSLFLNAAPVGNYETLLSSALYVFNSTSNPLTFSGLTIGQTYKLELWTPIWDQNAYATRYSSSASDGATNATAPDQSPTVNLGVMPGRGTGPITSNPEFIFGTFTANATTQNLYYFGNNGLGMVGALQLRAVPEPTTIGLMSLGGLALILRRRFRRAQAIA